MKFNKKIIALLLTLSIVFSVVMPISLTSGADCPTLDPTTEEVLGYINFSTGEKINVTDSDIYNATIANGIATFEGGAATDINTIANAIVFNSSLLANIKDTLTVEMVIRPHSYSSDHTILMSIGDSDQFYAVMGMRSSGAYKFNSGNTADNIVKVNEWATVKYVMNENGSFIYVNGVFCAKTDSIDLNALSTSNEPIKFGQRTVTQWTDPSFDGDVSEIRITTSGALSFNLGAVNLLPTNNTDTTNLSSSSVLTVQYTDATLGDGIKMYAQITDKEGNPLSDPQIVTETLIPEKHEAGTLYDAFRPNGDNYITQAVYDYSNSAGSVTFNPNLLTSYPVSDIAVTVWTANAYSSSPKANTTINNGFTTSNSPTGISGNNWMNYIDGATLLSQINLPGTHDSTTNLVENVFLTNTANRCQDTTITQQLEMGVRYLDIRADTTVSGVENIENDFGLSHNGYDCYISGTTPMKFSDIYGWCKTFLENNPSECIVFSVVNEPSQSSRDKILTTLHHYVSLSPELFYTKTDEIPTLDDVRGKIVITRRFPDSKGENNGFMDFFWKDNANNVEHAMSVYDYDSNNTNRIITTYFVQDNYSGVNNNNKWNRITSMLTAAETSKKASQYYINFFSSADRTNPKNNATTINGNFTSNSTILTKGQQYGYLIFDFITSGICQQVYNSNIFLSSPQLTVSTSGEITDDTKNKVVVHYDFTNVTNNTVADAETNGFDGTMMNSELLSVHSIYDMITFNNEGKHQKDAGYISIPQSVFRGTGDTATIQVWMKVTNDISTMNILSMGKDSKNIFTMLTNHAGVYERFAFATTKDGNTTDEKVGGSSTQHYSEGNWHLMTYVLNGDTMSVYMDDLETPVATDTTPANLSDVSSSIFSDCPVLLGTASVWGDPGFIGSMGDFTIYNYAVGTSEIATTYRELADQYTYITKATFGDVEIIAKETPTESYIAESKKADGSTIWFTLPEGTNLDAVPLTLEYDSSAIATISIDGTESEFVNGNTYDLSGNVVLTLKSIDDTSSYVKTYNVKVNGIIEKNWKNGNFIQTLNPGAEFTKSKDDSNLYVGWYTAQGGNTPNFTPATGDVVYNRTIAISNPIKSAQSVRKADPENGITKGIRFKAEINRDDFYNYLYADADYVYANATNFKFGMLMLPEDMLEENELTVNTTSVLNIKGEKVYDYGTSGGTMAFTGILVNLTDTFCDVKLVARAYIQYTYEGKTYTIYSEQWDAVSYNDVLAASTALVNE